MGLLFGLPNQIILAGLALGVVCLVVWGYRMWWHRRPTRRDRASRVATPLGSGCAPSQVAVIVVGGIGLVTSLIYPLLGVSLVAFMLFDVARSILRRSTRGQRDGAATARGAGTKAGADADVRDLV